MIVELDGEWIGETLVDGPDWKEYSFKINSDGGIRVLSVTFVNDFCDAKEDRNLFIGEARVESKEKSGKTTTTASIPLTCLWI